MLPPPRHHSTAVRQARPAAPTAPRGGEALMPQAWASRAAGGLFDVSSGPALSPAPEPPSGGRPRPPLPSRRPCCWPPSYFSWASPAPPPKEPHLPGPVQAAASLGSLSPVLRISVLPVPEPLTACTESASVPSRRTPAWPSLLGSSPSHPVCESGGQDRALGEKAG